MVTLIQVSKITTRQPAQLPVDDMLASMAQSMQPMLVHAPLLIAIRSGGVWVAEQLHQQLNLNEPLGLLDISFYRDDFSRVGLNPTVGTSIVPVATDGRHVILVDDIMHTGRTIRAALNELFAWGRPSSVVLAVLLDRGGRELPFHAEIVGRRIALENNLFVKISPNGCVTYAQVDS